jgi:tetratricopeptide (TPR) repeat protein
MCKIPWLLGLIALFCSPGAALADGDFGQDLPARLEGVAQVRELSARAEAMARVLEQLTEHPDLDETLRPKLFDACLQVARQAAGLAKQIDERPAYRSAARACGACLRACQDCAGSRELKVGYAELLYAAQQYLEAGRQYEELAPRLADPPDLEMLNKAMAAYHAAMTQSKLGRAELAEARTRYRRVIARFLNEAPDHPMAPQARFHRARISYDEGNYERAIAELRRFIELHPDRPDLASAGQLLLDCHYQREDFSALAEEAKRMLSNPRITDEAFRRELTEIIRSAETRFIQY